MKKFLTVALVLVMVFSLAACGGTTAPATDGSAGGGGDAPAPAGEAYKIGISMPTQSLQRWNQDGANMKQQCEAEGFTVDLRYAGDNDVPTQVSDIENMVNAGCNVIVIAAVDGTALGSALQACKDAGITVIAYDRLLMNSDAVTYYATFDNTKVGNLQGQYIVDMLDLENQDGPFNIELFTGDAGDNNIKYFFQGAIDILQPYIDSGKIVVPSGQTKIDQVTTADWKSENAQSRMENIISSVGYAPTGGKKLDAIMANNDSTAFGAETALIAQGWTKDNFPIVTGQDCDVNNVKNMLKGFQAMSVFKDTRTLAARVVTMVKSLNAGDTPETNGTYPNGSLDVPTFQEDPVIVTLDNYKEMLLDSGYYTEDQLAE
jgi:putative multiple sugar transport system substrate-binding protein